jgi:hypothetical protein
MKAVIYTNNNHSSSSSIDDHDVIEHIGIVYSTINIIIAVFVVVFP